MKNEKSNLTPEEKMKRQNRRITDLERLLKEASETITSQSLKIAKMEEKDQKTFDLHCDVTDKMSAAQEEARTLRLKVDTNQGYDLIRIDSLRHMLTKGPAPLVQTWLPGEAGLFLLRMYDREVELRKHREESDRKELEAKYAPLLRHEGPKDE